MADHTAVDLTVTEDGRTDLAAMGDSFTRDPYPVYAALRERGPVHRVRTPEGFDAWLVVGHEAARQALTDARLSKAWANASPGTGIRIVSPGPHMLIADPPDHTRLRKLIARHFTPRRIAALEPRVREITEGLLDAMLALPGGRADLVDTLAFPLPISVIGELLGVPVADRERFRAWTDDLLGVTPQDDKQAAARALTQYLAQLIERRREEPADDLFSALIGDGDSDTGAEGPEAALSREELLGTAWLLLIAGYETTVGLIANGVLALLLHPEQLAALRADASLLEGAVEEALRYDGPVEVATSRFTTEPVLIGDTLIPGDGRLVLPVLADAGRDPERFGDPDRFDIRRGPRGHLAFGHGIHFCLGAPLARLEGRVAFERLLARAPKLELDAAPEGLRWRDGLLMRGVTSLPVRFG